MKMNQYLPHQQRVIKEHKKLLKKSSALASFISSGTFRILLEDEQNLLREQLRCMVGYKHILSERILGFVAELRVVNDDREDAVAERLAARDAGLEALTKDVEQALEEALANDEAANPEAGMTDEAVARLLHTDPAEFVRIFHERHTITSMGYSEDGDTFLVLTNGPTLEVAANGGARELFQKCSDALDTIAGHGVDSVIGAVIGATQCGLFDCQVDDELLVTDAQAAKGSHVIRVKQLRVEIDNVLQHMKVFRDECSASPCMDTPPHAFANPSEVMANLTLSSRHLEDAVMRLGMTLKAIGNPTPYPESYNTESTKVEPTADGLKM